MNIILYENERVDSLYPFSVLHASWEILTGAFQNWQRLKNLNDGQIGFLGRDLIEKSFKKRYDIEKISGEERFKLYLDGSLILYSYGYDRLKQLFSGDAPTAIRYMGHIVGIYTDKTFESRDELLKYSPQDYHLLELEDDDCYLIEYLYQSIGRNGFSIKHDYEHFYSGKGEHDFLYMHEESTIGENVVIDTKDGPVIIEEDAIIEHGSVIYGPCYVGKGTRVKTNSVVEPDCSFGPVCKVGGEIENSIIHGYSNKQHAGFLGHSYLCEWVNIGANTDTSDLKNTYGDISISLRGDDVDTGEMFIGSMIGDHTKTAINTQLNTGTVIGIHSMIAIQGFPPTDIRSYNWTGSKNRIIYKIKKALGTAETVMSRRGKELNEAERELMEKEYERVNDYYYKKGQ